MKQNARIFVAGHKGLVGSAILRSLKDKGYTCLLTADRTRCDLANSEQTARFFAEERPEYVFAAAAKVGGIVANTTYRGQFIYENLMIQSNIIHQSYAHGVQKLLFLGSSCIYPKACPQPIKEEYLLTGPLEYTNEPYALAKIAGINMCESYNLQYGTNFLPVMPTNLYGPNDNYDLEKSHVLPALIRKFRLAACLMAEDWATIDRDLDKRPIEGIAGQASLKQKRAILGKYGIGDKSVTLWGTGNPRREFLYSEDMADACVYLMQTVDAPKLEPGIKELRNTHINIGTGIDLSIKELAETVRAVVGYEGATCWDSSKPDGTFQKLLDVGKLHSMGWKEKISLDEGTRRVFKLYCKEMM